MSSSLSESHGDPGGGRGPVSASTQSSELSTPSSLYMEYGEYSQPQWGHSVLVRFLHGLQWPQVLAPACGMLSGCWQGLVAWREQLLPSYLCLLLF